MKRNTFRELVDVIHRIAKKTGSRRPQSLMLAFHPLSSTLSLSQSDE